MAASGGHSSSRCAGLSLSRPLLLRSTGSRCAGSVIVAHGPSCSVACGILPDQGSNPCPLHWQADSQPLRHQGSPESQTLMREHYMHYNKPFEIWLAFVCLSLFSILKFSEFWNPYSPCICCANSFFTQVTRSTLFFSFGQVILWLLSL